MLISHLSSEYLSKAIQFSPARVFSVPLFAYLTIFPLVCIWAASILFEFQSMRMSLLPSVLKRPNSSRTCWHPSTLKNFETHTLYCRTKQKSHIWRPLGTKLGNFQNIPIDVMYSAIQIIIKLPEHIKLHLNINMPRYRTKWGDVGRTSEF